MPTAEYVEISDKILEIKEKKKANNEIKRKYKKVKHESHTSVTADCILPVIQSTIQIRTKTENNIKSKPFNSSFGTSLIKTNSVNLYQVTRPPGGPRVHPDSLFEGGF